ncbi:hypothetical protein AB0A95_22740 [Micromonospora sp. NPDC049230]
MPTSAGEGGWEAYVDDQIDVVALRETYPCWPAAELARAVAGALIVAASR